MTNSAQNAFKEWHLIFKNFIIARHTYFMRLSRNDLINTSFTDLSIGVCHDYPSDCDSDRLMHIDRSDGGDDDGGQVDFDRDSSMNFAEDTDDPCPNAADCHGRCWKGDAVDC